MKSINKTCDASPRRPLLILTTNLLCALALGTPCSAAEKHPDKTIAKPRMEVCFVLDTTGSMGGLIEGAKQKIWSIANEMVSAKPTPELNLALIAYRDRGDEYVVKSFDLTNDIDAVYAQLQSFRAAGGGDTPESVNEALDAAVNRISWSTDPRVLRIIFLAGDAPPHMDYDGPKYPDVCRQAIKKNIIINTVQCGNLPETTPIWTEIAHLSEGAYAAIGQSGNMAVATTPMDRELSELNRKLGATMVTYGSRERQVLVASKQRAAESAPAAVAADRMAYNLRFGGVVQGEGELLADLDNGKVKLERVDNKDLPAELRNLSSGELKVAVEKKQQERKEILDRVQQLNKERDTYLQKARLAAENKSDAFDQKVLAAVRAQAGQKGFNY